MRVCLDLLGEGGGTVGLMEGVDVEDLAWGLWSFGRAGVGGGDRGRVVRDGGRGVVVDVPVVSCEVLEGCSTETIVRLVSGGGSSVFFVSVGMRDGV